MDSRRLYEVGVGGAAWTAPDGPEARRRRLVRLRWLVGIGLGANAATWSLAGVAFAIGGPGWGAAFGSLALLTLALLVLPAAVEGWAMLRARRRRRRRPEEFPLS